MTNGQRLTPSLLDRLVDLEPRVPHEPVQSRLSDVREIKASVIRDLEHLLNTRKNIIQPPQTCPQVINSLFTYGLRDYSSENPNSPTVRQKLKLELEKIITSFEPRLRNLSVRAEAPQKGQRSLRFRIAALLVIDPVSEPISFDTYFDLNRSEYKISG